MKSKDFVIPKKLEMDTTTLTDTYGKFIAEPFERGYGHTIGNSLRRILLSSLSGAAVTAVKIEGAQHEYVTLPGVVEDVTTIIFNLKNIRFKLYSHGPEWVRLEVNKKGEVKASDIKLNSNLEILNPDTHIATLDRKTSLKMDIEVSKGRGYCPVNREKATDRPAGVIQVDAIFTPIRKVAYELENVRVGQATDYDRLIMQIWTDGSVKPGDALTYATKILKDTLSIFITFEDEEEEPEKEVEKEEKENASKLETIRSILNQSVDDIELSVRALNCLRHAEIKTIGDLVKQSEDKLISFKNFGKKSLSEIKDKLADLGKMRGVELKLGMEWPKEKERKK